MGKQIPFPRQNRFRREWDARSFRLRDLLADLIGPVALLAIVCGALLFPEVAS